MKKNIAITLTTINKPTVISDFITLQKKYEFENADYIIFGDVKTPLETKEYLQVLKNKSKINIEFFDINEQSKLFSNNKLLDKLIPKNSFARRNLADLYAYINGYDLMIRIDDDNFPMSDNFFMEHSITGTNQYLNVVSASSGWFNVCEVLTDKQSIPFYPRGFPYESKWVEQQISVTEENIKVGLNGGLWLGDPDVDAITRLVKPIDAINFNHSVYGKNFALCKNTWSPINTQNTSYIRELIPIAFVSPYSGRFDDILCGYFMKKIMDHLDLYVSFGLPLLNQVRNIHNLWSDLEKERVGSQTSQKLTDIIKSIELKSNNPLSCYHELIIKTEELVDFNLDFYGPIFKSMKDWIDSVEQYIKD